jgi:hypothetical protein
MAMSGKCHVKAALCPGKGPPVPIVQEAGWVSKPVATWKLEEKSFAPAGNRTPVARTSSPLLLSINMVIWVRLYKEVFNSSMTDLTTAREQSPVTFSPISFTYVQTIDFKTYCKRSPPIRFSSPPANFNFIYRGWKSLLRAMSLLLQNLDPWSSTKLCHWID